MTSCDSGQDDGHTLDRPAGESPSGRDTAVSRRLLDAGLRLRLSVLDLDDIAVEAAAAVGVESSPPCVSLTELEGRMAQVLDDLRDVRSRLDP